MQRRECPFSNCLGKTAGPGPSIGLGVQCKGVFVRKEDGRRIRRYRCKACRRSFCSTTGTLTWRQHKRRANRKVLGLLASKVSQRRIALLTGLNLKTVARKLRYWGEFSLRYLDGLPASNLMHVHFDEMQSSIHTKCKPVSIPMAIDAPSQRILAFRVCSMPAQPPLTEKAEARNGKRADDRPEAIAAVLTRLRPMLRRGGQITTDSAVRYPEPIARILPHVMHMTVKSRKACTTGQGEMKRGGYDPLFWFNHGAAMVRDGVGTLVRRTWATSKRDDYLSDRIALYAYFHNEVLLPRRKRSA